MVKIKYQNGEAIGHIDITATVHMYLTAVRMLVTYVELLYLYCTHMYGSMQGYIPVTKLLYALFNTTSMVLNWYITFTFVPVCIYWSNRRKPRLAW